MKISAAFRNAFRVYFGNFGASLKFLIVELCFTLAVLAPLLFLTAEGQMKWLALLSVPMFFALMLWARVNAAGAMWDSMNGGSLFSMSLADTTAYGKKVAYGLKRFVMLLVWAAPLIACIVIARMNMAGETDGFTVLRMIKKFGGGDLSTGVLYLLRILGACLLLVAVGCAFHSGDRHAFVRGNPKLLRRKRGMVMLCWLCSLMTIVPFLVSLVILVFRYLPALNDLTGVVSKSVKLPSVKGSLIIAGVGAVLTIPLLPLRSLITAAYVDGLGKDQQKQ